MRAEFVCARAFPFSPLKELVSNEGRLLAPRKRVLLSLGRVLWFRQEDEDEN